MERRRRRGMASLRRVAAGAAAGLLREQRRLELADAKRRGRARGRFALELGRGPKPSTTSSRSSSICSRPDIIRLPSASSSPRLLKPFFVSSLFESVTWSRTRDSLVREEKGSRRFVSLLCSCRCRGQRGQQQQRQSFFRTRRARREIGGVVALFFSQMFLD